MQEEIGRKEEIGGEVEYFVEDFWEREGREVLGKSSKVRGKVSGWKKDWEAVRESNWERIGENKEE